MLRNFPTTNTLANFFVIIVWLFILIVMLLAFSLGASEVALNLLGTLIITVVISLIVWVGLKLGWSRTTWKIIPILMIIVGLALGAFIYTRYSDQTLVERTLQLEGKEITMLIPKNLGYKEIVKEGQVVAGFGRKGQKINAVGVSVFKPSSPEGRSKIESATCSDFRLNTFITVNVSSLNKSFEVCKSVQTPGESYLTANVFHSEIYIIGVTVEDSYLVTVEGEENIKKIFESFRVNEQ